MPERSSEGSDYSLYSPAAEIEQVETELATILYICGLDGENPQNYTIDEVIDAIRETFSYKNQYIFPVVISEPVWMAHEPFMRRYSQMLSTVARRCFRWLRIARYVEKNA